MNLNKLIFLLFLISFASCNNQRENNNKSYKTEELEDESFYTFVENFYSRNDFALSRLCDDVIGFNSENYYISEDDSIIFCCDVNDSLYHWRKDELMEYYSDIVNFRKEKGTIEKRENKDSLVIDSLYRENSSCFILLTFKRNNHKWYLYELSWNFL